ncbi:Protein of unknown function, partial [Cotesia congregata]
MSDHTEEQLENGGSNGGHTLKRHREEDSSGSSDSGRSRALSLPPLLPRKRRRFSDTTREIRALHEKVELLSDLLLLKQNAPEPPVVSMPATAPQTSVLNLGQCKTEIICGKRASCIEARRERILTEAPNKQVQGALRRIPPSSEHLFGKENLSTLITSLGGAQTWLKEPSHSSSRH